MKLTAVCALCLLMVACGNDRGAVFSQREKTGQSTTTTGPARVPEPDMKQFDQEIALRILSVDEHRATRSYERSAPRRLRPVLEEVPRNSASESDNSNVWARLAECESSNTNVVGGRYSGYFQFDDTTWHSVGGTGRASDHSYEEQLDRAKALQVRSGWGRWPACSRKIGVR